MRRSDSSWAYDEDRCYHGVSTDEDPARVYVELCEFGPTERTRVVVLRELQPQLAGEEFGWGHVGGGPGRAAMAILTDALGSEPSWELAGLFNLDFLAMCPDEFWIRRSAVLRWTRGLLADRGVSELPEVLSSLPPVEKEGYGRRPPELAWAKRKNGQQSIDELLK